MYIISLSKKIWSQVSEGASEMAEVSAVQAVVQTVVQSGANSTSYWNVLVQGGRFQQTRLIETCPKKSTAVICQKHTFWKSEVSCQMVSLGGFDSESLLCHIKDIGRILSLACSSGLYVPIGEACPLCIVFTKQKLLAFKRDESGETCCLEILEKNSF